MATKLPTKCEYEKCGGAFPRRSALAAFVRVVGHDAHYFCKAACGDAYVAEHAAKPTPAPAPAPTPTPKPTPKPAPTPAPAPAKGPGLDTSFGTPMTPAKAAEPKAKAAE